MADIKVLPVRTFSIGLYADLAVDDHDGPVCVYKTCKACEILHIIM